MTEEEYNSLKIDDYIEFIRYTGKSNVLLTKPYKIVSIYNTGIGYLDMNGATDISCKEYIMNNCKVYNKKTDRVNHPSYYNSHPSGIECIDIIRYYNFDVGNVIKYLWRAGLKKEEGYSSKEKELEDCEKTLFYLKDHIEQLKKGIGNE